jgi:hypothetical protein
VSTASSPHTHDLEAGLARVHANDGKEGVDPPGSQPRRPSEASWATFWQDSRLRQPQSSAERITSLIRSSSAIRSWIWLSFRASKSMPGAFPIEELGDFVQAETGPLAEQDRLHPPDRFGRVAALPSGAVGRSNEPDPVVVAERRRGDARPRSQFSDRQPLAHGDLLT